MEGANGRGASGNADATGRGSGGAFFVQPLPDVFQDGRRENRGERQKKQGKDAAAEGQGHTGRPHGGSASVRRQ